ncbi:MAG TPA: SDR family oxidoreductase [Kiritimatiellia bacterium]|jgi:NAD(P)-dependent dehydrogenase (short-subunit alcohol dehydrogenase family)
MANASRTFLITGCSRGIGLELCDQLLEQGHRVIATARNLERADTLKALASAYSEQCRMEVLDVTSEDSVQSLIERLGPDAYVDVLVNNAGVFKHYETPLPQVNVLDLVDMYNVNTLGPLRVTRAMMPLLQASTRPIIVNISTGLASISDNTGGKAYAYRMSKAALNMFTKTVAMDYPRIICVAVDPGWVRTDMGGPDAPRSVDSAVRSLVHLIEDLKPDDSGMFLDTRGGETHW